MTTKIKIFAGLFILAASVLTYTLAFNQDANAAPYRSARVYEIQKVAKSAGTKTITDFTWKEGSKTVSFAKYTKGKVVLLNFWGTWCPPCRKELPDIVELSKELKNFVVVGVALEDQRASVSKKRQTVIEYATKKNLPYINLVGNNTIIKELAAAYGGKNGISGVPTTFIINKNGKIVEKIVGGRSKADFLKAIKRHLK
ncbi:MAG: TlpA family protein disulfide reductase [Chlorobi bacterium]|nr:TlpA family protein disulfide reductase [Chlorobiota bacterium]